MWTTSTAFVALCCLCLAAAYAYASSDAASTSSPSSASYQWGTYRPNVYFGVRARHGSSPLFGLLWAGPFDDAQLSLESIRHDAEERDQITKYGWLQHDGHSFGVQEILDANKHVNITTTFLNPVDADGSVQSDRWIAHVELQPHGQRGNAKKAAALSLLWYVALDKEAGQSLAVAQGTADEHEDIAVDIAGGVEPLRLTAHLPDTSDHPTTKWWSAPQKTSTVTWSSPRWVGLDVADSWNAKAHVRDALLKSAEEQFRRLQKAGDKQEDAQRRMRETPLVTVLPNTIQAHSTLLVFQHIVTLPYSITFSLEPSSSLTFSHSSIQHVVADLPVRAASFASTFAAAFPLQPPFSSPSHTTFAQAALSNLVGGIGFFHGSSLIETSSVVTAKDEQGRERKRKRMDKKLTPALSLLSSVPSRSFFPRGFLWDEGFHQLLVGQVDLPLSLDVLSSWMSHILPSGWLPREQIPGEEARRRVPEQFQVQKPHIANPPVLVLSIGRLVTRLQDRIRRRAHAGTVEITAEGSVRGAPAADEDTTLDADIARLTTFIESVYPALQRHADWYYQTQSAVPLPKSERVGASRSLTSLTTFRWAGRTLTHCLASGLDDYPRAPFLPTAKDALRRTQPNEKEAVNALREGDAIEGHVDLHSWMVALAQTMSHLAAFLHTHSASSSRVAEWEQLSSEYRAKALQLLGRLDALHWSDDKQMYCDYAYHHGHHHHICHAGYITFLPLFMGHVSPTSPHFSALLDHLTSPSLLTPYGLRSLSSDDPKYATAEDYWRGHIWVNLNYLACQALASLAANVQHTAPHQKAGLYNSIRTALGLAHRREWGEEFLHLLDHLTPARWEDGDAERLTRLYEQLRMAVVGNVYDNYERKGFLYENYNSTSGEGRGSHPFTGWTALVVNLMAERY